MPNNDLAAWLAASLAAKLPSTMPEERRSEESHCNCTQAQFNHLAGWLVLDVVS